MKSSNLRSHTLLTFDLLPSTSDYLKENDLPTGTIVRANAQSAGRGRRGNGFLSQAGGLYFSVKLPRSMADGEMWAVTFMAANALCDVIGEQSSVKWVNDVYIDGRKVAGILTEVRPDSIILGVGVNVKNVEMPPELKETAVSLEEKGIDMTADAVLEGFFAHFDSYFDGWDIPLALEKYRPRSLLTGKEIRYTENGEIKYAKALGIADNGNLICQRDGETFTLSSGEVHTVRNTIEKG